MHLLHSWKLSRVEDLMALIRRQFFRLAGATVAASAVAANGFAQPNYPAKPIRILLGFAAGGPASVFVYTLAPDTLLGWTREPTADERAWLPAKYADLPALGRLTGRGNTANVEVVLAARPDIVLDFGTVGPTYVSLADRVQEQTKVPYVLLDGSLSSTPRAYTLAGDLLGVPERAGSWRGTSSGR